MAIRKSSLLPARLSRFSSRPQRRDVVIVLVDETSRVKYSRLSIPLFPGAFDRVAAYHSPSPFPGVIADSIHVNPLPSRFLSRYSRGPNQFALHWKKKRKKKKEKKGKKGGWKTKTKRNKTKRAPRFRARDKNREARPHSIYAESEIKERVS